MGIRLWWYKRAALRFVNQVLAEDGHRPVKRLLPGRPVSSTLDPIARTLRPYYNNVTVTDHLCYDGKVRRLPMAVLLFSMNFDKHKYPSLVQSI